MDLHLGLRGKGGELIHSDNTAEVHIPGRQVVERLLRLGNVVVPVYTGMFTRRNRGLGESVIVFIVSENT